MLGRNVKIWVIFEKKTGRFWLYLEKSFFSEKVSLQHIPKKFQGICNFRHRFRIRGRIFRYLKKKPVKPEKPVISIELRYCNEIAHISAALRAGHESLKKMTGKFLTRILIVSAERCQHSLM